MSRRVVQFSGVDSLQKALASGKDFRPRAQRVVRYHSTKLTQTMMRNAVFTKGYSTGETQRSIGANSPTFSNGGMEGRVGATTEYAPYLEYGTRFMAAQPFCDKSLKQIEPSFYRGLQTIVKNVCKNQGYK